MSRKSHNYKPIENNSSPLLDSYESSSVKELLNHV